MEGHEIIETVFEEYDETKGAVYYLGKSIELMEKCERVVFMPGWEKARGCRIEYDIAKNYGKEILLLKEGEY